jgi:hypothetical protein
VDQWVLGKPLRDVKFKIASGPSVLPCADVRGKPRQWLTAGQRGCWDSGAGADGRYSSYPTHLLVVFRKPKFRGHAVVIELDFINLAPIDAGTVQPVPLARCPSWLSGCRCRVRWTRLIRRHALWTGTPSLIDGDALQDDVMPNTLANVAASYTAKPVRI